MNKNKREFIKKAVVGGAATAAAAVSAPYVQAKSAPIKWRLQTYAGAALGAHVIKPAVDAFNKAANGEMEIELYYADQLVPTPELFRALQKAPSMQCRVMTIPWGRRWIFPYSAVTSRLRPVTAWMYRYCSNSTV
ncbi:hypothetical protein [Aliamphritea spongicola]|nr:hypothetical protein [Aliamphritea spongicola]